MIGNILETAQGTDPESIRIVERRLLDGLNPEQRAVVEHDKGPLLVGAVAGAGKTHALIRRVGYLVAVRGVHPARILAVTFSKKGADEMQERLDALIGQSDARIGTFHSLAYEILRTERPEYREWKVDDRNRYRICLKDATGYKEMDWKKADVTVLESFVSLCKCDMARPDSATAKEIAQRIYERQPKAATTPHLMLEAYSRAEEIRRERQLLGFDDMLVEGVELLRDNDDIRHRWASKYEYVLQDEAQDQNLCQLLMGELLAQDHRNYMLVGDPAQTVYTWRGARPEKLLGFEKNWGARLITMNRNYRCGIDIIAAANLALKAMDPATRLDMEMICERTDSPGTVVATEYGDLDEEGIYIADQIKQMLVDQVIVEKTIPCCEKCTNALLSKHEEGRTGHHQSARVVRNAYAIGEGGGNPGMQPINDRPDLETPRTLEKAEPSGAAEREMEGRTLQDENRLHSDHGGSQEIPNRAPSNDGTEARKTIEKERSGPPQGRKQGKQQSGEPETVREQFHPHEIPSPASMPISGNAQVNVRINEHHTNGNKIRSNSIHNHPMDERQKNTQTCSRCSSSATNRIEIVRPFQPKDAAILFRTNAQSRAPEEALISARIPYRIIGGASFYERKEVKDLLAYLRLAEGRGDLDDIGRCINAPFRFLGRAFVDRVRDASKESKAHKGAPGASWGQIVRQVCAQAGLQRRQRDSATDWATMIEDLKFRIERARNAEPDTDTRAAGMPARILEDILRQTQYTEWLQKDEGEESTENSRVSNVREMVRAAGRFTSVADLLDYVDKTLAASKKQRKEDGNNPNKVTLCSLHRAKGLEWTNVFLTGASEKILPHGRCEDIEEERRLFYVGVTRARDRLSVSCVANVAFGAKVLFTEPSRFIEEAGLTLQVVEPKIFEEEQEQSMVS